MARLSLTDWLVIVAGIAAIAWVNWYFFFADSGAAPSTPRNETTPRPAARRDLTRTQ